MNSFVQNLCYYREREGLSQAELAKRIGVTPHTIANYESGKTTPSMKSVLVLAHMLNITTDQLLGFMLPARRYQKKSYNTNAR